MAKNDDMLAAFDKFKESINLGMDAAREQLVIGDYIGAQRILAAVAQSHARTSLSLRSLCIKRGLMKDNA